MGEDKYRVVVEGKTVWTGNHNPRVSVLKRINPDPEE